MCKKGQLRSILQRKPVWASWTFICRHSKVFETITPSAPTAPKAMVKFTYLDVSWLSRLTPVLLFIRLPQSRKSGLSSDFLGDELASRERNNHLRQGSSDCQLWITKVLQLLIGSTDLTAAASRRNPNKIADVKKRTSTHFAGLLASLFLFAHIHMIYQNDGTFILFPTIYRVLERAAWLVKYQARKYILLRPL